MPMAMNRDGTAIWALRGHSSPVATGGWRRRAGNSDHAKAVSLGGSRRLLMRSRMPANMARQRSFCQLEDDIAGMKHQPRAGLDASSGMRFSMEEFAVRAAIAGMGFALVTKAFVSDDLAKGQLVRALTQECDRPTKFHHYVVYPPLQDGRPNKVAKFRDWLLEEAATSHRGQRTSQCPIKRTNI